MSFTKEPTSTRPISDYKFILGFAAAAFYLMETFFTRIIISAESLRTVPGGVLAVKHQLHLRLLPGEFDRVPGQVIQLHIERR